MRKTFPSFIFILVLLLSKSLFSQSIWSEGFEGLTMSCNSTDNTNLVSTACIPSLWTTNANEPFVAANNLNRTGSRCLRVRYGFTGWLETRSASLIANQVYTLSFYFRTSCPSGDCKGGGMTILAGATSTSGVRMPTGNMTQVANNQTTSSYVLKTYTFIPVVSGTYVFQIRVTSSNTAQDWSHFDDFNLSNGYPLPVQLKDFDAVCKNGQTNISWSTFSERNNDYFVVEKMKDNEWTVIHQETGNGNSNTIKNYTFSENSSGNVEYYRLIQYDYDGKYEIFGPIYSNCEIWEMLNIFPNPTYDIFRVSGIKNIANVRILDVSGKLVMQKMNITSFDAISLENLNTGIYLVQITQGEETRSLKIVKK